MDFDIHVDIDPEMICNLYKIELSDFLQLIEGKNVIHDEKTILFVIEEYISILEKNKRKAQNTINAYINFLRRFGKFILSKESKSKMTDLTEELFYEFTKTCSPLKGEDLTAKTKNNYQAILRNLITFAITRNYLSKDLRGRLEKFKEEVLPRYVPDVLVPEILKEAKKSSWPFLNFALIYFMLGTGCRVSEVSNLRICDCLIDEDLIFIRKSKGQKERTIPMYPQIKILILDFLKRTGSKWDIRDQSYLFTKRCYENREQIPVRNIQYSISTIYEKLGIGGQYTVHSLRHTFAVNALKAGMAIHDLQEILGHNNIETTRIYTKRRPADLKDSVQRYPFPLEKLLSNIIGIGG